MQQKILGKIFIKQTIVGISGFEPETSSLSVTRSNQLSYTPYISIILFYAIRTRIRDLVITRRGGRALTN